MGIEQLKAWCKANPERMKAKAKRSYERRKARGLCTLCVNPADPGKVQCAFHRRKHSFWAVLKNSGATPEWFAAAVIAQSGRCAICQDISDALQVDHDHETGLPRALLCTTCNTGIGHLRDDPVLVAQALDYLIKHKQPSEVALCSVVSR